MYCEYMVNGDLMQTVNKFSKLSVDHGKFYTAQIVSVFEYLHAN